MPQRPALGPQILGRPWGRQQARGLECSLPRPHPARTSLNQLRGWSRGRPHELPLAPKPGSEPLLRPPAPESPKSEDCGAVASIPAWNVGVSDRQALKAPRSPSNPAALGPKVTHPSTSTPSGFTSCGKMVACLCLVKVSSSSGFRHTRF